MTTTETEPGERVDPLDRGIGPLRDEREWWHRHLEPEERRRVMSDLAIVRQEHWAYRFTVMITLSVVVAVMGLSANSAAVVIGAMLLAPLMQPVLATAGCLSMALFRKALASFTKVLLATAWAIALSYFLAKIFVPDGTLANEIVSRTKPDIRDLVVALGAGAAGSYATVRKDASAALPGVAVAVALIPPLSTVGIALEANNMNYARGAMLLYTTNLVAIVFASVVVFIITGFVPPRRLATTSLRLAAATIIVVAVVTAISIPLYRASQTAVAATNDQTDAGLIVDRWLGDIDESRTVDVGDDRITVEVRSFEVPIDDGQLRRDLAGRFGSDVAISVVWDRIERASTTTTVAPTTTVLTDEEILAADIESTTLAWLEEADADRGYELISVRLTDGVWRIDAAGVGSPPSFDDLEEQLIPLGSNLSFNYSWTERQEVTTGTTEPLPTPAEVLEQDMRAEVDRWSELNDLTVTRFVYDGERATLEVAGPVEPDINVVVVELIAIVGEEFPVDVFFTERRQVTTTTLGDIDPFQSTTTTG